jgi:hypothetical protein
VFPIPRNKGLERDSPGAAQTPSGARARANANRYWYNIFACFVQMAIDLVYFAREVFSERFIQKKSITDRAFEIRNMPMAVPFTFIS